MNDYCVYCHISPSNKKYVGISRDPEKRWNSGRGYSKNYRFYRAIRKYGWDNFSHIILAENLSLEDAEKMERDLIEKWNLTDYAHGYNLREGGHNGAFLPSSRALMSKSRIGNTNSVGRILSEAERKKISESLSAYYSAHPNPFSGRRHSAETISKLRNREFSNETRAKMRENHAVVSGEANPSARPIRQLSIDGEVICEYPYAKLAADKLGIDLSSIIKCCRGKTKTCGGYRWEYK